jgi:hypothetical protein
MKMQNEEQSLPSPAAQAVSLAHSPSSPTNHSAETGYHQVDHLKPLITWCNPPSIGDHTAFNRGTGPFQGCSRLRRSRPCQGLAPHLQAGSYPLLRDYPTQNKPILLCSRGSQGQCSGTREGQARSPWGASFWEAACVSWLFFGLVIE